MVFSEAGLSCITPTMLEEEVSLAAGDAISTLCH